MEEGVGFKEYVDVQITAINKRLDESRADRERIREAQGQFITRVEHDVAVGRIGRLETSLARIYGALGIIAFLAAGLGVLVKFLTG